MVLRASPCVARCLAYIFSSRARTAESRVRPKYATAPRPVGLSLRVEPERIAIGDKRARSYATCGSAVVRRDPGRRVVRESHPGLIEKVTADCVGAKQRLKCPSVFETGGRSLSLPATLVVESDDEALASFVNTRALKSSPASRTERELSHSRPVVRSRLFHASGLTSCCHAPGGCSLAGAFDRCHLTPQRVEIVPRSRSGCTTCAFHMVSPRVGHPTLAAKQCRSSGLRKPNFE